MPTSATGRRNRDRPTRHGFRAGRRSADHGFAAGGRSAEHGFTLVELMVVVTILALAAGAVAWSLPDPAGKVGGEAARFALRVRAARDEAVIEGRPVSVWVTAGGYGFDARADGAWQPMAARPLTVERWTPGTQATAGDPATRARVVFDPTGMADRPLDVRLQRRAARATVRIGGDGSVSVDG